MDEFSAVNRFVGEDWESECNDSTVAQAVSSRPLFDVHGVSDCETACVMFNDSPAAAAAAPDNVDNDDNDGDDVKEECETVEHCTDKREFVTDKKKVFVSNVNYRTTQRILWSALEHFGKVQYCRLLTDKRGKSKGCAVVTYANELSANAAVNATGSDCLHLHNRELRIHLYRRLEQPAKTPASPDQHKDLSVTAASDDVTALPDDVTAPPDDVTADVDRLNDDVILHVFSFLRLHDRVRCQRVCRRWCVLVMASWSQVKLLDFTGMLRPLTLLTDDILKSMLCRGLSSLHAVALSVPCSAVTDTSLSLIARHCPNLRTLVITGGANVSNNGLKSLANGCTQLTSVTLHDRNHRIGEKGLWWLFHRCKQLQYVNVDGCCLLKGQCLHVLTVIIESLSLSQCTQLRDVGLIKVSSNCASLRHLNISGCRQLTDHSLRSLNKLSQLVSLNMSGSLPQASSVGLMVLSELHVLQSLTVKDNCLITDDVLQAVSHGCPMLTCLDMSMSGLPAGAHISDDGLVPVISRCHRLTTLSVSRLSLLTDAVLVALAAEGHVTSLTARGCDQFTNTGVTVLLRECHELQLLDVTGCFHVGNASLRTAVDVADHTRRALTVCVGGTGVDVQDLVLPVDLPSNLTVDLSTPYNMLVDLELDFDSDESDADDLHDAEDSDSFLDNDDALGAERWQLT